MRPVAVVLRTKNRHAFLHRALKDIFTQSFQDFCVVVVNDGGEPGPVDDILAGYETQAAGRLSVVHHSSSLGMEAASNAGIAASESQFLVIHDDDDLWHRDFLLRTVGHLRENPQTQGVAVRTEIRFEEVSHGVIRMIGSRIHWPEISMISLVNMMTINRVVPISFLYRRSMHQRIGGYDERLSAVGDWEFYLRFLAESAIDFLDGEPLAYWCQRPGMEGAHGNSLFAAADDHRHFDGFVRDDYVRAQLDPAELGRMLYQAQLANQQFSQLSELRTLTELLSTKLDETNSRLADLEATFTRRTSLTDLAKRPLRLTRRVGRALRGSRG